MTREEAGKILQKLATNSLCVEDYSNDKIKISSRMGAQALRPVSREQVEKVWRGEWEVDEFGHKCSKCGEYLPSGDDDIFPQFCPNCGDAKTDEAVEMVMERMAEM